MSQEKPLEPLPRPEIVQKTLKDVNNALNQSESDEAGGYAELGANKDWESVVRSQKLIQAIFDLEFDEPSAVQAAAIPALSGDEKNAPKSMIAQAPTGSGKTVAFIISMMNHIDANVKKIQAVCLCHTPELVDQSAAVFEELNKYTRYVCGKCRTDDDSVPADCQAIFARPLNLVNRSKAASRSKPNYIDLSQVKILIIDEADELCKRANKHLFGPMQELERQLPKEIPIGFFSATFADFALKEAKRLRPELDADQKRCVPKRIIHSVMARSQWGETMEKAFAALRSSVGMADKLVVFAGKRDDVSSLEKFCKDQGITCGMLIGGRNPKRPDAPSMTLEQRREVVRKFKSGQEDAIQVLITTDLGARGLDIPGCSVVINFDFPHRYDDTGKRTGIDFDLYQHKAGRCGRFGRNGIVINVYSDPREKDGYTEICARLRIPELWEVIPDPAEGTPSS